MPEPQEKNKKGVSSEENKSSKILDFFSTGVKEAKKEKAKPFTKVVIRRLPPRMTKEAFLEEFELPEHDYFCFVRGDLSMGSLAFSRAYVNFLKGDDIFQFKEKYDDYVIHDEQGRDYNSVVEWAPVQKIPRKGIIKKPPQSGPIEADPKYCEFLEKLEKEKNNVANSSGYFMETEGVSSKEAKVTTTPLLEFLKVRKQQKLELKLKRREAEKERRRKEDEARKTEKVKKVREKKTDDKTEAEPKDTPKTKSETHPEIKEKKIEVKSGKTDKAGVLIKSRVFEKRDRASPKEVAETRPRNQVEAKPKRDTENKKPAKPSPKQNTLETEAPKSREGNKPVPKDDVVPRKEAKSKFRYSEQRNRSQKLNKKEEETKEPVKEKPDEETRHEERRIRRQSTQDTSDGSVEGDDKSAGSKDDRNSKDPRTERRIRNKDRPTMQIYRPGMGRFSKQRIEPKKDDDASESDDRKSDRSLGERKKPVEETPDESVDPKTIDPGESQTDVPAEDGI